jgi:hypothetical protein
MPTIESTLKRLESLNALGPVMNEIAHNLVELEAWRNAVQSQGRAGDAEVLAQAIANTRLTLLRLQEIAAVGQTVRLMAKLAKTSERQG